MTRDPSFRGNYDRHDRTTSPGSPALPSDAPSPRHAATPVESTWLGPRLAILPTDPLAAETPAAEPTVLPLRSEKDLPMHLSQHVDVSDYLPSPADRGTRVPARDDPDARLDQLARHLGSCHDEVDVPSDRSDEARNVLPLMRRRWSARRRLDAGHPFGRTARLEANLERLLDELEAEVARLNDCLDTILVASPLP